MPLYPGKKSPLSALFVFPVDQATLALSPAPGLFLSGIPFPDGLSGRSVESHDLAGCGGGVEDAPDDEVVGLVLGLLAGIVTPGHSEGLHIPAVDLRQRRIEVALLAAKIDGPVRGRGFSCTGTCPGKGRQDCEGGRAEEVGSETGLHWG